MSSSGRASADVVIVGAGFAGSVAAELLARSGIHAVLVDPHERYRACFKAEKIEPDQAAMLQRHGLLAAVLPWAARIREIRNAHAGRVMNSVATEQYGVFYHDMINAIRAGLTRAADFRVDRVDEIAASPDLQLVRLASGATISSRVVIVADGGSHRFDKNLGLRRRVVSDKHSVSFGFTIARNDGEPFSFDALTYFADRVASHVDFLTLFPIRDVMRANLFVYQSYSDPRVRRLIAEPVLALRSALPGLVPVIGEFSVVSKVESGVCNIIVAEPGECPGVVLVGDAFQTVCPATGTGLTKVLTDVELLCTEFLPSWLATPGMSAGKIAGFYSHSRKKQCDNNALQSALYRRRVGTDASLRWKIHRKRMYVEQALLGWRQRVGLARAS